MIPFISVSGSTITIDGSSEEAKSKQTHFTGGSAVQLRRARTEESGFQWEGRKIDTVVIKNTLIYDSMDIACLNWFIDSHIKINCSGSSVSPDALDELTYFINELAKHNIKVMEGSSIRLPQLSGYSGMARSGGAQVVCQKIGFSISWS